MQIEASALFISSGNRLTEMVAFIRNKNNAARFIILLCFFVIL
jgi:hypothetical protein